MPKKSSTDKPTSSKAFSLDASLLGDFLRKCHEQDLNHNRAIESLMRKWTYGTEQTDREYLISIKKAELKKTQQYYDQSYDNYLSGTGNITETKLRTIKEKIDRLKDDIKRVEDGE